MTAPVWPADWHREALIRPDRYVAMRELLCPLCGKTGHVAGDCGKPWAKPSQPPMMETTTDQDRRNT